ncbi:MAG: sulfotransferase [Sandaracinaceae bacterium]|nr:sulfotransferase [Sandaracinaceae bacterium]
MQDRLLFIISPPRSGSTLLQRLLGSHSEVFTHPEPHLITPLAYLGYHDTVDKAPYDHINAAEAIRLFVSGLPHGEQDYLDAVRAYSDTMYERMLATSGRKMFLDKTPAYALVLDFLQKLYPHAKYIVLTRHPLAVMSSFANSFFEGDWQRAHEFNPVAERYVPAMSRFMREKKVPQIQVSYEKLVADPEPELARMFEFLGLPHQPEAVEYGKRFDAKKGMGDPITVNQHDRPVTDSVHKWANELAADDGKRALAERIIEDLDPADLALWGYPKEHVFDALTEVNGEKPKKRAINAYTIQRRIMLALKKDIHTRPHGELIRKVRYYCDVLLRD